MSQTTLPPHIIAQYRNQIWYALDYNQVSSAIFTAERLRAFDPEGADSVHLLAMCYFKDNRLKAAEHLTKKYTQHLGCAYMYAQCCLELEGKQKEGITALQKTRPQWQDISTWNKHTDTHRHVIPDAAAVYCLLGKLQLKDAKEQEAIESFVCAVKVNPFIWDAFEGLVDTGAKLRIINIFKQTPEMLAAAAQNPSLSRALDVNGNNGEDPIRDPFISKSQRPESGLFSKFNESFGKSTVLSNIDTETPQQSQRDIANQERQVKPPGAPLRKTRIAAVEAGTRRGLTTRASKESNSEVPKRTTTQMAAEGGGTATRRSTRLLNTKLTSKFVGGPISDRSGVNAKEKDRKGAKSALGRSKSAHIVAVEKTIKSRLTQKEVINEDITMADANMEVVQQQVDKTQHEAQHHMLETFKIFGNGYFQLARFQCQAALEALNNVPTSQKETSWVLSKIGIAHFELTQYGEAQRVFEKIRKNDPTRTKDMEMYSTLLWHLRKDVELSYLAHELVELDRFSPEAWCALGNTWSLQRDHEQALKCFKRATQLDPKLAYAFTLQGHEHVSSEDYEKALAAYRQAIQADNRHYNAWYGLGRVYEKTGKYSEAEQHFKRAAQINPTNSVLICCIGTVLEKEKKMQDALEQYERACELAPRSALCRFRKGRALMALNRFPEALHELNVLKDIVPDEANVHFVLGKCHKAMRNRSEAIKHFTTALHLDPKASHVIKEAMESLEDGDIDEDSGMYGLLGHS